MISAKYLMSKHKHIDFSTLRIVILCLMVSSKVLGGKDKVHPNREQVIFHTVTIPGEQRFALEQLTQNFEDEDPAIWPVALKAGQIKLAEADLNDDGVTERFIMAGISDWCGSVGCRTLLVQKIHGRWQLMGSPSLPEEAEATFVLEDKRFGYHKLHTGHGISTFKDGETFEILDLETGEVIQ